VAHTGVGVFELVLQEVLDHAEAVLADPAFEAELVEAAAVLVLILVGVEVVEVGLQLELHLRETRFASFDEPVRQFHAVLVLAWLHDLVGHPLHPTGGGAVAVEWPVGRVVHLVPALDEQERVHEVDLGGGLEADLLLADEVELGGALLVRGVFAHAFGAELEPNVRLVETLILHLTPQPLDPDLVRVLGVVLVVVAAAARPLKEGKL